MEDMAAEAAIRDEQQAEHGKKERLSKDYPERCENCKFGDDVTDSGGVGETYYCMRYPSHLETRANEHFAVDYCGEWKGKGWKGEGWK